MLVMQWSSNARNFYREIWIDSNADYEYRVRHDASHDFQGAGMQEQTSVQKIYIYSRISSQFTAIMILKRSAVILS